MIRLIRRRLIIPRGDTGSFSIPTQGTVNEGDIAIFGIFDPLTHKTVLMKKIDATKDYLTVSLDSEDTINLEVKKYNWDITIYKSPIYDEEDELIGAAEVNSYYSAFKLPICEITEVALDMCKQRWKTRDLVVDEGVTSPFSSIQTVYPWENLQISSLSKQIYSIAVNYGYTKDEESFWDKFSNGAVIASSLENFPAEGEEDRLYLDKSSGILYYFIKAANEVNIDLANAVGAVFTSEDNTSVYLPIKALPVENLIFNGGEVDG